MKIAVAESPMRGGSDRRRFLKQASVATGALAFVGMAARPHAFAQSIPVTDADILNFALNVEY
ncbi:MAG: twin-arginine translocation signal domain-containing protein, partial [Terriglobales bacterium]